MKIVITADEFHLDRWYVEHYLATELGRLGHDVHVFSFKSDYETGENNINFTLHRLPHIAFIKPYHIPGPRTLKYIINFVRCEKPDIIHCQPLFSPLSLSFIISGYTGNHRVVGSLISGTYSLNSLSAKLKYILTRIVIERYVLHRLSYLFVKSKGLRKIILNLYSIPEQRIGVVPLGADPDVFKNNESVRAETRNELGLSPADIAIVCSGRMNPSKRVEDLIEAVAPIIKDTPNVKVLIRGGGEETYLKRLVVLCRDLDILQNVSFLPWASRKELAAFFNASDITVWPNGASISMVEAAATGRPLIAMKSPIEEYAISNNNGLTFEYGDTGELQRLLKLLVSDERLRKEMGYRSRALVESKLNWRTIAEEYIEYYKLALKTND